MFFVRVNTSRINSIVIIDMAFWFLCFYFYYNFIVYCLHHWHSNWTV